MCLSPSAWTLVLKALFPVKLFFWNSLRLCNILIKFHNESHNYLIYSQLIFVQASYQGNSFLCQGSVSMAFLHVLWCSWCKWKCSGVKFFLYSRIKQRKNHIQGNRQLQSFCIDLAWIQSLPYCPGKHQNLVHLLVRIILHFYFEVFPTFQRTVSRIFFSKSLDTSSCNVAKFFSPQLINLNKFHFFSFFRQRHVRNIEFCDENR